MSRYINADEVVNALCKGCGWYEGQCDNDEGFWCETRGLIEEATHIDIVRCKECKRNPHTNFDNHFHWCYEFDEIDGYCPYGERRE